MSDHEATAKALLPCMPMCHKAFVDDDKIIHMAECPFKYRPAVAAALAQRDMKIAGLRETVDACDELIAQLRAKLAATVVCAWCETKDGVPYGVPCPFHRGCERAYELTDNEAAVIERSRAELLQAKLGEAEREVANRAHFEKSLQAERDAAEAKLKEAQTDLALARSDARITNEHDFVRGLERAKEIANNEPEYPGVMPDDMWLAIKGDKDAMAETMRITVRLTKSNIENAIAAEIVKGG